MERVHYRNEITDSPSESIWGDPELLKCLDPKFGFHLFDDFVSFPPAGNSISNTSHGDYVAFTSAGGTIAAAAAANGIIEFYSATDAQAASLALLAAIVNMPGADAGAASTGKKFACEFRVKTDTIADTKHEFFAGLMGTTALSAVVPITNTDGSISHDIKVGFYRGADDGDVIDTNYFSVTDQADVKEAAITAAEQTSLNGDTIPAFAADTFIKLGMVYEPNKTNANGDNLSFYADGLLLDEGLTNQEIYDLTALAAGYLRMVFAYRAAASTGGKPSLDWWKFAMVR